jgi:medium-chain acyl-[acyl-carrier-protein] hydrolase
MRKSGWIADECGQAARALRLFCFHCAGGGASQFRHWAALAPPQIQILRVQLPGRESRYREPPMRDVHQVVDALAQALGGHLDQPFAFFGHSIGALLALELTRYLRSADGPLPCHLFVASRPAPQVTHENYPIDELPDRELLRVLRVYGGVSESLLADEESMRWFLPTIRADFHLARTYVYEHDAPLECPITAFVGESDALCSVLQINEWRDQTNDRFHLETFPGGHFFLRDHSRAILARIASHARSRTPAPADVRPSL